MVQVAVRMTLLLTLVTGIVYPLAMTGFAEAVFPRQAHGSLLRDGDKVTGSELLGQQFEDPRQFWGRLSATTPFPYNAASSTGSNFGPSSPDLKKATDKRRAALLQAMPGVTAGNGGNPPIDLITASGSGLDPHISPEAARFQAERVAKARGLEVAKVNALVERYIEGRQLGVLGEPVVNVVLLNRELDKLH
jgi:K+-transporting ATPase ATPase C chain